MTDEFEFSHDGENEERLDKVVTLGLERSCPERAISRSQVKQLIEAGQVEVNETVILKPGKVISPESEIRCTLAEHSEVQIAPYDFSLDIVHEDESLLVVNKPAGLTVHPGAGTRGQTLLNAIVHHIQGFTEQFDFGQVRPGIVHRLDKDTTGLLVVAKTGAAHQFLSEQFAKRSVKRAYRALVLSTPRGKREIDRSDSGTIDAPIGRSDSHRTKISVRESGGRKAITNWKVEQRMDYATLLDVRLETGRTHQIRVHMDWVGSPVIGDRTYGDFAAIPKSLREEALRFGRQALHAYQLGFQHPETKQEVLFEQQVPDDFQILLNSFQGG